MWLIRRTATAAAIAVVGCAPPPLAGPPELDLEVVVPDITLPWEVAFTPDGHLLFTEKETGRVSMRSKDGSVQLVGQVPNLFRNGNCGLMGLAVDPDFDTNRRIYLCHGWDDGEIQEVRVSAYTVGANYGSLTAAQVPLVSLPVGFQDDGLFHHAGCRVKVGAEGSLWIGSGDASTATFPQDTTVLAGKVLRIDRFSGDGVPGNPFFDDENANRRRIYSYGHRNVQGLAQQPGSGRMFSVEHGSWREDEINLLSAGGNYGWSCTDPVTGEFREGHLMTDLGRFPMAIEAVWNSGDGTLGASGAGFLENRGDFDWGAWNGALVVAHLKAEHLRFYSLDSEGALVGFETALEGLHGRLRSVTQGPDGALYVSTSNGGNDNDRILRLTPRPR